MLFSYAHERKNNVMLSFVNHVKTYCINLYINVTPLSHGLVKQQSLVWILRILSHVKDKSVGRKISRGKGLRKIALLSLYLLYLYHVRKTRGGGARPPLPTPMVMDSMHSFFEV